MQLQWVRKICDDGMHNAFTDLAFFKGHYYVTFRRAEAHAMPPDGDVIIVVVRSDDLENWQVCGTLTTGWEDCDPKLLVDGDRMLVYCGAARKEPPAAGQDPVVDSVSWAAQTSDGETWEAPRELYRHGWWLWRPARFDDGFYCAAYGHEPGDSIDQTAVDLLKSPDGLVWTFCCRLLEPSEGNETALHRLHDGRMLAVVRGLGKNSSFMEAKPPYTDWSRCEVGHTMQAPAVAEVAGKLIVAGRYVFEKGDPTVENSDLPGAVTRLWEIRDHRTGRTEKLLDLPSRADTSYCGLVTPDEKTLLISYYSQHEFLDRPGFEHGKKPAAIYLAKVTF